MDPFVIHEFRDRAASLRDLLDTWFEKFPLSADVERVDQALIALQASIEGLAPKA